MSWRDKLGNGRIGIGADPATTEKQKSNPFAISIVEEVGLDYILRLVIRFKTSDPDKAKAYLREACDLGTERRPHRLCIDATSERFWAAEVKREFRDICPVTLVVSSEKTTYMGQDLTYKQYLGNLVINTIDDGHLWLPEARWLKDDFRLVVRSRGTFETQVDSAGNHGDTFDSTKLALHALIAKGGPVEAAACRVGTYGKEMSRDSRPHRLRMRPDHSADYSRERGVSMP